METGQYGEYTYEQEYYGGETEATFEGIFSEADEIDLATELLEVMSEEELEQFIGNLIRRATRVVGQAIRSPLGRTIGGMLKGVAKQALPMAGAALGNLVLPGVGGMMGGQLAGAAGRMFGLELEGMSDEDQQFEVARRIVRLGGETVRQAVAAPPTASPQAAAQAAIRAAAQLHAPGLIAQPTLGQPPIGQPAFGRIDGLAGGRRTGRWYRRGSRIVLVGA